jgi:hypothetical protein
MAAAAAGGDEPDYDDDWEDEVRDSDTRRLSLVLLTQGKPIQFGLPQF